MPPSLPVVSLRPHLFPDLHVHLAAAAKSCTYLEHFPLIDDLLTETVPAEKGFASPPERPGHGISWDRAKMDRYRVR